MLLGVHVLENVLQKLPSPLNGYLTNVWVLGDFAIRIGVEIKK